MQIRLILTLGVIGLAKSIVSSIQRGDRFDLSDENQFVCFVDGEVYLQRTNKPDVKRQFQPRKRAISSPKLSGSLRSRSSILMTALAKRFSLPAFFAWRRRALSLSLI